MHTEGKRARFAPVPNPETAETPVRWTLPSLAGGDPKVTSQAAREAQELAKALAAQSVALAADADAGEYADRLQTLSRTIWPADPLEGFELHSSLGAFLVARVAFGWSPPTPPKLREVALGPDGVVDALVAAGVDRALARSVVADWRGVSEGFAPDGGGLEPALLAGLAERSLAREERDAALSQVSLSPRCLARLATAVVALDGVRRVLPVLPAADEALGPEYVTAIAAMALGRPERALALVGPSPSSATLVALAELAGAQWALQRGEAPTLHDDTELPIVPVEMRSPPARDDDEDGEDDEDGVMEIVEEVVAGPGSGPELGAHLPVAASWRRPGWETVELDDTFLKLWKEGRRQRRAFFGHLGSLLGIRSTAPRSAVPSVAVPPDLRTIRRILDDRSEPPNASTAETERIDITAFIRDQQEKLGLSSTEPLYPTLRASLRAVVAAAEGVAPSADAVTEAGDLAWVIRRARALALAARGDLDAVRGTLASTELSSPEARWADARRMRFAGREARPAELAEGRRLGAVLISDLAFQLGRTISGAVI